MKSTTELRQKRQGRARAALAAAGGEGLTLQQAAEAVHCPVSLVRAYLIEVGGCYMAGRWYNATFVPKQGSYATTYHDWLREDIIRRNPPRPTDPVVPSLRARMGDI